MFEKISKIAAEDELLFHKLGMILGMIIGVLIGLVVSAESDQYVIEEIPNEVETSE